MTLQATQGLDFGAVTKPGNAGANTVTLDAASSNVTLSGAGDGARAAGSVSAAKFSLIGQAGITYSTTQSLSFAQPGLTHVSASTPVAGNGALGRDPGLGRAGTALRRRLRPRRRDAGPGLHRRAGVTVNYN